MRKLRISPERAGSGLAPAVGAPLFQRACSIELSDERSALAAFDAGLPGLAFAALASRVGAFSDLADATDVFNRAQIKYFASVVKEYHANGKPLGILGLTYKPETDVVEEAFGHLLAQELSAQGISVLVYDPEANLSASFQQLPHVQVAHSAADCVSRCETVLIATPWAEFRNLAADVWQGKTIIDCWRSMAHLENHPGMNYVRLGHGGLSSPGKERYVAQGS